MEDRMPPSFLERPQHVQLPSESLAQKGTSMHSPRMM